MAVVLTRRLQQGLRGDVRHELGEEGRLEEPVGLAHALEVPHVLVERLDGPLEFLLLLARRLVIAVPAF